MITAYVLLRSSEELKFEGDEQALPSNSPDWVIGPWNEDEKKVVGEAHDWLLGHPSTSAAVVRVSPRNGIFCAWLDGCKPTYPTMCLGKDEDKMDALAEQIFVLFWKNYAHQIPGAV